MNRIHHLILLILFSFAINSQEILPNDIPDLLMWYDAQDESLEPGLIEVWPDKSGNGYDAIQTNPNLMPSLLQGVINGKNMISFNGSSSMLSSFSSEVSTPSTYFILFQKTDNSNGFIIHGKNIQNSLLVESNNRISAYVSGSNIFYNKSVPFEPILTTVKVDGISSFINENSINVVNGNLPNASMNGLYIGRHFNGAYPLVGDIAEIIYFSRSLSETEIEDVEKYLSIKYGGKVDLGNDIPNGYCNNVIYANNGEGFQSYLWSDGTTNDSLIVNESGIYWCEVTNRFGMVSRDSIEVIFPLITYPTFPNYCPSDSKLWHTNLSETDYTFLWSDGSTSNQLSISTEQDVWVSVTDTLGCTFTSDTLHFFEDPFPALVSLGEDTDLCVGNTLRLAVGADEAVSYVWTRPNGETGETSEEITVEETGNYSVIVENANGCVAEDEVYINILGEAPVVDLGFPEYSCKNAPVHFEDLSYATDGSQVNTWEWDFGNTTSSEEAFGEMSYAATGTYEVSLQVGTDAGCFADTVFSVEVKDNPLLTFSTVNSCQRDEIEFLGGQLSPVLLADWSWDFGDANSAENTANGQQVTHSFQQSGNFLVTLTGTDIYGCKDSITQLKIVDPAPTALFEFNEVCEGEVVHFQNLTEIDSPGTMATFEWNLGDGSTSGQSNPQKPYISYGEYPIHLKAISADGCWDTVSQVLKIHGTPQVDYSFTQACAGMATQFTDASFVPNGSVAQVEWSFNGQQPQSGFSIERVFAFPSTYNLKQTVKSAFGCSNSKESFIDIFAGVNADFAIEPNAFVVDEPVQFTNLSEGAEAYYWEFGDFATSTQADTVVIFTEDQIGETYTVLLIASNSEGCQDSSTVSRTVLGRETDLALSQLFHQEVDGYLTVGVRIQNKGMTPLEEVELTLFKPGIGAIKELWTGHLSAGEEEIFIFSSQLLASVPLADSSSNYICVEGRLISQFEDEDLSNNEVCIGLPGDELVVVRVYPNPFRGELKVKVIAPTEQEMFLQVVDDMGRVVFSSTFEVGEGASMMSVDATAWRAGVYYVRVGGSFTKVVKL